MNIRLYQFLGFFVFLNLIFIPLLSLYGLRACPVLSIPGFGFGCYYTGIYIALTNLLNLVFLYILKSKKMSENSVAIFIIKYQIIFSVAVYLLSTVIALSVLHYMLEMSHLTTQSRAPEILAMASLLLGITQAYGLNWASQNQTNNNSVPQSVRLNKLWINHIARTLAPILVVVVILLHFLFSQSIEFNNGRTAPVASHDSMITETAYVVSFLLIWLLITFSFHFMSEKDHVNTVKKHLNELGQLNFAHKSSISKVWGLWLAILHNLNDFSMTLGERTRLLKSFSKFVTRQVAEQALKDDFSTLKGSHKELTVLMSDIRGFTSLSENLKPEEVVVLLNDYFTAMLDVFAKFDISVDKFIGDGILAYVDLENANQETENAKAVEASIAMLAALDVLNTKLIEKNLPALKIGIGLFRGPLVIGLIGTDHKLQHTIIGDTVNKASRLESLTKELNVGIVISGHIWHSLPTQLKNKFQSYGKKSVKGISESMEVFGGF